MDGRIKSSVSHVICQLYLNKEKKEKISIAKRKSSVRINNREDII